MQSTHRAQRKHGTSVFFPPDGLFVAVDGESAAAAGLLYFIGHNWNLFLTARTRCPSGWHLKVAEGKNKTTQFDLHSSWRANYDCEFLSPTKPDRTTWTFLSASRTFLVVPECWSLHSLLSDLFKGQFGVISASCGWMWKCTSDVSTSAVCWRPFCGCLYVWLLAAWSHFCVKGEGTLVAVAARCRVDVCNRSAKLLLFSFSFLFLRVFCVTWTEIHPVRVLLLASFPSFLTAIRLYCAKLSKLMSNNTKTHEVTF